MLGSTRILQLLYYGQCSLCEAPLHTGANLDACAHATRVSWQLCRAGGKTWIVVVAVLIADVACIMWLIQVRSLQHQHKTRTQSLCVYVYRQLQPSPAAHYYAQRHQLQSVQGQQWHTRQPTHCTSAPTSLACSFSLPSANACAAAQIGCKCAAAPVQATGISGQQLCKRQNTEPVVPLGRRYHPSWPYPLRRRDHGVPVGAGGGARAEPLPVQWCGEREQPVQIGHAVPTDRPRERIPAAAAAQCVLHEPSRVAYLLGVRRNPIPAVAVSLHHRASPSILVLEPKLFFV